MTVVTDQVHLFKGTTSASRTYIKKSNDFTSIKVKVHISWPLDLCIIMCYGSFRQNLCGNGTRTGTETDTMLKYRTYLM